MKILTGKEIQIADCKTIERQDIESLELMERASESISQWICNNVEQDKDLLFFVGKGNNGGDGLAIARMLSNVGYRCGVYIYASSSDSSDEFKVNLERLPESVNIIADDELDINEDSVIIDTLLGSGLKGEIREQMLEIINLINSLECRVISIDLPSGMKCESPNDEDKIIHAETTLTLEFPKLSMLLPEAGECCGKIEVIPIELDAEYIESSNSPYQYVTADDIASIVMPRRKFGYKNQFGHTLLICGSVGMSGAAILATSAALRSGCGLVTTHIPAEERFALHASCPPAIASLDSAQCFSTLPSDIDKYNSIVVGCGLGVNEQTVQALTELLKSYNKPMVIDADAINIIASNQELLTLIPENSILTPHLGELKRLQAWSSEEDKLTKIKALAKKIKCYIIVKGAHSAIYTPEGSVLFNSSGCSGMAKAGCGDILAGLLGGLIARGYNSLHSAMLGVYIHGVAGEKAQDYYGAESMNSSDIIDFLAEAMVEL